MNHRGLIRWFDTAYQEDKSVSVSLYSLISLDFKNSIVQSVPCKAQDLRGLIFIILINLGIVSYSLFSLLDCSSSVKFHWDPERAASFKSLLKFYIGFKLGCSRTLTLIDLQQIFFITLHFINPWPYQAAVQYHHSLLLGVMCFWWCAGLSMMAKKRIFGPTRLLKLLPLASECPVANTVQNVMWVPWTVVFSLLLWYTAWLMREISSSCCWMHSLFSLRFGLLKLLQSFHRPPSSPTSAPLAWTVSCWGWPALGGDSCEQTVYGSRIGFGNHNFSGDKL